MGGLRLPICVRCGVPAKSRILWGAREFYGLERLWRDGRPLDLTGVLAED